MSLNDIIVVPKSDPNKTNDVTRCCTISINHDSSLFKLLSKSTTWTKTVTFPMASSSRYEIVVIPC